MGLCWVDRMGMQQESLLCPARTVRCAARFEAQSVRKVAAMQKTPQRGFTLPEILFIIAAICLGTVAARWAGARWGLLGYPLGFVAGVFLLLCLGLLIAFLTDVFWSGIPPHPTYCRRGKCRFEDFEIRKIGDDAGWFCRCGDRYQKRGRRWVEILPDGSVRPYVIWKAFKGWLPDEE